MRNFIVLLMELKTWFQTRTPLNSFLNISCFSLSLSLPFSLKSLLSGVLLNQQSAEFSFSKKKMKK